MRIATRYPDICGSSFMLHHLVAKPLPPPLPDESKVVPQALCLASINLDELQENLQDADLDQFLSHWLSPEEQKLYSGFSLTKRRIEWLAGRMTAKTALLHLAGIDNGHDRPSSLSILPSSSGRPFCGQKLFNRHGSPLFFSITHSGNHAIALAAAGYLCGIDIQVVTPSLSTIRGRFCEPMERKSLRKNKRIATLRPTEQLALLWCSKEAFRKTLDIEPMPAFKEMELQGRPRTEKNVFHLPMRFRREEGCFPFFATAWLHNGAAAALTIIAAPGGLSHG